MCIFSLISWAITFLFQEEDEDEDFEEESDDDDTAALLAELEKIKKERAEEQARKVKSKY